MKGAGVEVAVEVEEGTVDPEVGAIADIAQDQDRHHQAPVDGITDQEVVIMIVTKGIGVGTIADVGKGLTVAVVVQVQGHRIIQEVKLLGEGDTTMVATAVVIAVMLNVLIMLLTLGALEVVEVGVSVVEEHVAAEEVIPEIEAASNLRLMIMVAFLTIPVIIRRMIVMTMRVMKTR